MYKEFFGFHRLPFAINPDEDFFYPDCQRQGLLDAMELAVLEGEGIIKVVGGIGTGKTTLCRLLCQRLPSRVHTALIIDPKIAPEKLCDVLLLEFGQKPQLGQDEHGKRQQLQNYLIHLFKEGQQALLLLDEAQSMLPETYEELLFFSNIETYNHKLLQMIFFGRPELDRMLGKSILRPIGDRITQHMIVPPFSLEDTRHYIQTRLDRAFYGTAQVAFSPQAFMAIHGAAHGSLRRTDVLAHDALVQAFREGVRVVEKKHVHLSRLRKITSLPRFGPMHLSMPDRFPNLGHGVVRIPYPKPSTMVIGILGMSLISGTLPLWLDGGPSSATQEVDQVVVAPMEGLPGPSKVPGTHGDQEAFMNFKGKPTELLVDVY
ncbi:MAG: AAA family ATPase [Magnetococcus sp. THC-1_WYH]